MVDPAVKEQIRSTHPEQTHSLMLEWTVRPDDSVFAGIQSKRERLERMNEFYRRIKEPMLAALQKRTGLKVRDLPASGQAIITAPAAALGQLVEEGGILEKDPGIRVLPNVTFHTL